MRLITALRLNEFAAKPIIALTGAGGKSTLLFRLGDELATSGRQVLLTTTTRLWARQIDLAPFCLITPEPALLAQELPVSLRGYRQVLAMAGPAAEADKLRGLAPETVCALVGLPDVHAAVVEADGSRERPLKAPARHEPSLPFCTTHPLTVAGMAAIGHPLDERSVHRPQLVATLTGLTAGERISAEAAARLLLHPEGGLKGTPPGTPAWLYLNLMDDPALPAQEAQQRLEAARHIARTVLAIPQTDSRSAGDPVRRYAAVLIGSAAGSAPVTEVHGRVAAIVLAAGQSRRFGPHQAKQLLPWGDAGTLVGHVVDSALAATAVDHVIVVTGCQAAGVQRALAARPAAIAHNDSWQLGQSSSVHCGLRRALALLPDLSAVLFLLADQPDVLPETINALVEAHRHTLAPIVAPRYAGGRWGNPVLFDRRTFPELLALSGDMGGRPLIQSYGTAVHFVPVEQPQPQGIETPEDYRRRHA